MNGLVSMCVALGILAVGCSASESDEDRCADAEVAEEGDGGCDEAQAGLECRKDGSVIECVDGAWQEAECSIFADFSCHEAGEVVSSCSAAWEGLSCPWSVADAGFSCRGTARCKDGDWVSNGVDELIVNE